MKGFYLQDLLIEPTSGRVSGPGVEAHLKPKAVEVLLYLAERPFELVERDELLRAVWGDNAGSPEALTHTISELRTCCNDHASSPSVIQTVPRRGYRLVTDVKYRDGTAPAADPVDTKVVADAPAEPEHASIIASFWIDLQRRHVVRVAIAYVVVAWLMLQVGDTVFQALQLPGWTLTLLLALLVIGFPIAIILAWVFQVTPEGVMVDVPGAPQGPIAVRRNLDIVIIGALVIAVAVLGYRELADTPRVVPERQSAGIGLQLPINSIAVLRFLNIGGEPHFADGLGEELLDRLANLKELGVAARTSSWAFAGKGVDVPTIAKQLDVDYVLEGSVRQSGDRIRITAQLNDGETGKHIWSQTYDRELTPENFFETQSEIARHVVDLLQISLSPESEARLAAAPQTSMAALEFYLKGQELFRMPHSDATLREAADYYRRALEVDPRFAMAYAGLCDVQQGMYVLTRDVAVFEDAERACHRALTLDEDLPRVLSALGGLYLFSGQFAKAEETLARAISENPNLIDAYADLGEALEFQGRAEQAEQAFRTMISRQPGFWYAHNAFGMFLYRQSRFEEAAELFTKVVELIPDRALGYNNLANANYMMGDFDTASRAYEMSVAIEPYTDNYSNLGLAYFYGGQYEKAAEMQIKASEMSPNDPRILGRLATAYQYLGQEEDAQSLYRRAIELIEEQLVVNPNDIRLNRFLAVYNVGIGDIQKAQVAIEHALKLQPESSGVHFDAAKVALAGGRTDKAIEFLTQAKVLGYSINIIRSDPYFEALHNDAQFRGDCAGNDQRMCVEEGFCRIPKGCRVSNEDLGLRVESRRIRRSARKRRAGWNSAR
ncbi:MAG: tetratricopeptide repeat protein [Gammaproteobacteria bacterium]